MPYSNRKQNFIIYLLLVWLGLHPIASSGQNSNQAIIRYDSIHHPVISREGMVVSQNAIASKVGRDILAQGGNAVDATVAIGFALAVTLPRAGNLGGSGFMLIYMSNDEAITALDFRSKAPAAVSREDLLEADGSVDWDKVTFGPTAAAVPGTVAGLEEAWLSHGSLPWKTLLAPAIELAREGFIVSDDLAFALSEAMNVMSHYPSSVETYGISSTESYKAGELLKQPDLQWSLQQISEEGAAAFYTGAIAERLAAAMIEDGGYISASDLAAYTVSSRKAIQTSYRNHRVVTMPPSSVGGIAMLQMLNVLQQFDLAAHPHGSASSIHLLAETMKRVNANRRQGIGDTDFIQVPLAGMLSEELALLVASQIREDSAASVSEIQPIDANPYESRETTHFSVVDRDGNAVSTTYTLGYSFGSGYVASGTGILLDNQMRNFSLNDPEHANRIEPGKRVVSTMTPTMVFDPDGKLLLVTGTPGGSRIHTTILQVLVNVIDYGMNIAEATHAPRIYQGWRSPELGLEKGINPDSIAILKQLGHEIEIQQTMGSTQSIMLLDGLLHGSADPRRPGALALGLD